MFWVLIETVLLSTNNIMIIRKLNFRYALLTKVLVLFENNVFSSTNFNLNAWFYWETWKHCHFYSPSNNRISTRWSSRPLPFLLLWLRWFWPWPSVSWSWPPVSWPGFFWWPWPLVLTFMFWFGLLVPRWDFISRKRSGCSTRGLWGKPFWESSLNKQNSKDRSRDRVHTMKFE